MKQYQNILFDWDGTLAMTLDIWLSTLRTALKKRGYDFDDQEIGANYESFKQFFISGGYTGVDEIINDALYEADLLIPEVILYESASEILESLNNHGSNLGLVTTSNHSQIDPLLKSHRIADLFKVVVCGDDTESPKPDPAPIMKAMEFLKATKENTIIVGDSEKDLLAAQNAGIDSVLFYPESHTKFHDLSLLKSLNPTYTIHNLN